MGKLGSIIALAGSAFVLPALATDRPAQSGAPVVAPRSAEDPLRLIYRVSGVRDDGKGPGLGVATSFHCTNWSNVTETLSIGLFNWNSAPVIGLGVQIESRRTYTISTHYTNIFDEDTALLPPGISVNQGIAHIAATTTNIFCSAMIVDAASSVPEGISLHLVRFNPLPGTTE